MGDVTDFPPGGKTPRNPTGAGRKPGSTDKNITPRKYRIKNNVRAAKMVEEGKWCTPLEFFIHVFNDAELPLDQRMDAAKSAAPFMHAKLVSQHTTTGPEKSHEDWLKELDQGLSQSKEA